MRDNHMNELDHLKTPARAEDRKRTEVGCLFRESTASDEPAIREILREANLSFHPSNDASNQAPNSAFSTVGSTFICLCEVGSEIVAVLQWRHLGEEAEILELAVPVSHRRKGYARFLLRNFLGLAQGRDTRQIFLEVRESNSAALALYREFGFEQSGRRANYYRDPIEAALVLQRKLTG
jgi:ribosomal-protein-alanine acetyltransferase